MTLCGCRLSATLRWRRRRLSDAIILQALTVLEGDREFNKVSVRTGIFLLAGVKSG
jgi:hypothetical protein